MDITKILEDLDSLFQQNKMDEVEPYLQQALHDVLESKEYGFAVTIVNELIGFYRDTSQYEKSNYYCDQVLILLEQLGKKDTFEYATTQLNIANAYRASGKLEESLLFFKEVEAFYQKNVQEDNFYQASFYNNFSLLYQELQDFNNSIICLKKALAIVLQYPDAKIELAVTYINLANSYVQLQQLEEASFSIEKAITLFDSFPQKDFHFSGALATMGDICSLKEDYSAAKYYYEKSLYEIKTTVGITEAYQRVNAHLQQTLTVLNTSIPGLTLCESYFQEYGKHLLQTKYYEYWERMAIGMVGYGSDCFGFDDAISMDHDFGPAFCIWLTKEDFQVIGEKLQKDYDALPSSYFGISRKITQEGKKRVGVFVIEEFYEQLLEQKIPMKESDWENLSEEKLAVATNGRIFIDNLGKFSEIRDRLLEYYPREQWLKKIATTCCYLSQTGQYNYPRMTMRTEVVSSKLILSRFVELSLQMLHLLNRTYNPFYKWQYASARTLPWGEEIVFLLDDLINDSLIYERKLSIIQQICDLFIAKMKELGLTNKNDSYLAHHSDEVLTRMLEKEQLVELLIEIEWKCFDHVKNKGGRADCQNDFSTFKIMRKSQYLCWSQEMLLSYINDFQVANERHWNLITEKYAWMMESTNSTEFKELESSLPVRLQEKLDIINEIVKIQVSWMEDFSGRYPEMAKQARSIHTTEDTAINTSYETYLRGELSTYSEQTLSLYGNFVVGLYKDNQNLADIIMTNTANLYGYASLDDAENRI